MNYPIPGERYAVVDFPELICRVIRFTDEGRVVYANESPDGRLVFSPNDTTLEVFWMFRERLASTTALMRVA